MEQAVDPPRRMRRSGPAEARSASSAVSRLGRRLVERHVVDAFERRLDTELPDYPVADEVRLRRLDSEPDVAAFPADAPAGCQRTLRDNLQRGDSGWYAVVDGRFAGWLWVSRVSHRDRWSGLRICLGPDEAYAYGWWVLPEYRKDGIAAALMARLLADLKGAGDVRRVYGWADRDNKSSQFQLRLLFGFTPVQQVRRMRVLDRWGRGVRGSEQPGTGPLSCSRRCPSEGRRQPKNTSASA